MAAPWAPMMAPPLPLHDDPQLDSCPHAFGAETCPGHGPVTESDVADLIGAR